METCNVYIQICINKHLNAQCVCQRILVIRMKYTKKLKKDFLS
ncbi:unnamed protein product [Chironomus riparius]|uniref:Uncharacterized protein n=1 Tax=Chironomus riparius TaxID=315576 RepID=A0A9N9RX50_9DIPT|nr:unnamed protein product [Chironomus riparius]